MVKVKVRFPKYRPDCLLETLFIHHHVNTNLHGLLRVVFYLSPFVSVTAQRVLSKPKTPLTIALEYQSRKTRTARKVTIPPMSRADVQKQCPTGGICSNQNPSRLAAEHYTSMVNGLMDIFPHKPFHVVLSNFFPLPVHLSRTSSPGTLLELQNGLSLSMP